VNEKASKEEVMKLATRLIQRDDICQLQIYDARAAYGCIEWEFQNLRDHPTYPEKELMRHYLVRATVTGIRGKTEVEVEVDWIAKGRDEQGAGGKVVAKTIPRVETEAEQREREARDRQRREELRKNKPEQDARQAKEESDYRTYQTA
jgi:hypothetical protein